MARIILVGTLVDADGFRQVSPCLNESPKGHSQVLMKINSTLSNVMSQGQICPCGPN
jgi:hypothetical protein